MSDSIFSNNKKVGQTTQSCPLNHFFKFSLLPVERKKQFEWWPHENARVYSDEWFIAETTEACEQNKLPQTCSKTYFSISSGYCAVEFPEFYESINSWINGQLGTTPDSDSSNAPTRNQKKDLVTEYTNTQKKVDGKVVGKLKYVMQASNGKLSTLRSESFRNKLLDFSEANGGKTVVIVSGYRSPAQQDSLRKAGNPRAAKKSSHSHSDAADVKVEGMTSKETAYAAKAFAKFRRVNWYKKSAGSTHVDDWQEKRLGFFIDWVRQ